LKTALDEVGRPLDAVNGELESESQCKATIVELLQRQTQALGYAENQIKQLVLENDSLTKQAAAQPVQLPEPQSGGGLDMDEVRLNVQKLFSDSPDFLKEVLPIFEGEDMPPASKIVRLIGIVAERFREVSKPAVPPEVSNQRLVVYYSNLLQFLDQLANSREV
jgi:hypothetical protein